MGLKINSCGYNRARARLDTTRATYGTVVIFTQNLYVGASVSHARSSKSERCYLHIYMYTSDCKIVTLHRLQLLVLQWCN